MVHLHLLNSVTVLIAFTSFQHLFFTEGKDISDFNKHGPEEMVTKFFDYFKQDEPRGIPVLTLPETLNLDGPLVTYAMTLTKYHMRGHTDSQLLWLLMDVPALRMNVTLDIPTIEIGGHYVMPGMWYNSEGELNSILTGVVMNISIGIGFNETNTAFYLNEMDMDMDYNDMDFNMTGLTMEHQLLIDSGIIHTFFQEIFKEMFMANEEWLLYLINKEISRVFLLLPDTSFNSFGQDPDLTTFINFILDQTLPEPITLPDAKLRKFSLNIITKNTELYGISALDQIKQLRIEYRNKILYANLQASVKKLFLKFWYNVSNKYLFINFSKTVKVDITKPEIFINAVVDPSLKTPPQLKTFVLKTEGLKVHTRGKGIFGPLKKSLSYLVDKNGNFFLNIIDDRLKKFLQNKLNTIDIEESIKKLVKE